MIKIYEDQLDSWGIIDIDQIIEMFGEPEVDDNGTYWLINGADDNGDGIPDVLADLVTNPIVTNPSQGGALG